MSTYSLDFPRAYGHSPATGVIKQQAADFVVHEVMAQDWAGSGEHDYLWVEKTGQNTGFVANALARHAGVREMDVGYSGLKDRHAVTRQWFSVYRRGQAEIDWSDLNIEGVALLNATRHERKLRRGEHVANWFQIIIRDLATQAPLTPVLEKIAANGFPNYFGEQRFGRDAANLTRGAQFFAGELKASRKQRGFYLSAARSYLFNLCLAQAINDGRWQEAGAAGPLYGDAVDGVAPLSPAEVAIMQAHPELVAGLHANRLQLERRPYCVQPEAMSWLQQDAMLCLEFTLPTGVFATALIAELVTLLQPDT